MVFDVAILNNFDKSAPPVKRGSPNGALAEVKLG